MQVLLNVYDVSTAPAEDSAENKGPDTIVKLNNVTRQLGLGGVFHGAVEVNGWEWSFGYCEKGTGVYRCHPKNNPMYVFRETIDLGVTLKTKVELDDMLRSLKQQWLGLTYDLLSRNCCHFCEQFCERLGVKPVPAWLNRFATSADATVTFANDTVVAMRALSEGLSRTAQTSVSWVKDSWQRIAAAQSQAHPQHPRPPPCPSDAGPFALPPLPPAAADAGAAASGQPPRPASARISGWFKDVAERMGGVNSQQPASAAAAAAGGTAPRSSPPSFNLAPAVQLPFSRHRRSSNCSADSGSAAGDSPAASAATPAADHTMWLQPAAASGYHAPGQRQQQPQPPLDASTAQGAAGASADVQLVVSGTQLSAAKPAPQLAVAPPTESLI